MRGRHRSLGVGHVCAPKGATSACLSTDCGSVPADLVFCLLSLFPRDRGRDLWAWTRVGWNGVGGAELSMFMAQEGGALQGGRAAALWVLSSLPQSPVDGEFSQPALP